MRPRLQIIGHRLLRLATFMSQHPTAAQASSGIDVRGGKAVQGHCFIPRLMYFSETAACSVTNEFWPTYYV